MTTQASCKNLCQKFSQATLLKDQAQAVFKNAETSAFEKGSLTASSSKAIAAFAEYQKEAAKLVKLPDGRQIQQRDYLALKRFIEGCESKKFSKQDLWEEVSKIGQGDSNGIILSEEGRVIGLILPCCKLTHLGELKGINRLQVLMLASNQLTGIAIPASLTNLHGISLGDNHLTSIEIPFTLTNLRELWIGSNFLTNIDIPHTLTDLKLLWLKGNPNLKSANVPLQCKATVYLSSCPNLDAATIQEARKRNWRLEE